jgi:ATP-dependent Clp protease adapter protein ClpS
MLQYQGSCKGEGGKEGVSGVGLCSKDSTAVKKVKQVKQVGQREPYPRKMGWTKAQS